MTFVIDGGGWNVLDNFPDQWPNLKRLMGEGANFRNAIVGSFPAVTACAHASIGTGTFPSQHGITGHNIRDGKVPRKAYGTPGQADPGDILVPTLADLWSDQTDNRAWVGEIGYQVWHMGMLGYGGRNRPADAKPVGVYWAEDGSQQWEPHNPELFRMPGSVPGLDVLAAYDRRLRGARVGCGVRAQARQPPVAVLQPADRALPGRPARGDLRLRADRRGRRDEPALHDLQVARLHGPRVRDVLGVDRPAARGGRRRDRPDGRPPRRALPGRVRADRDRRPRTVPAPRRGRRRAPGPDPAPRAHRGRVRRRGQRRARAGRRAARDLPRHEAPLGRRRRHPRGRRGVPARLHATARTSARTCRGARSSRTCSTRRSSRRCSRRRTWRRSPTSTPRRSARRRSPTATTRCQGRTV